MHHVITPLKNDTSFGDKAVAALAVVTATGIANGYYVQPLLLVIAGSVALPQKLVGILPALSQIGLALGLIALLPLADGYATRRVLLIVLPLQVAAVVTVALGRDAATVMAGFLAIGFFRIAPYAIPPYASLNVSPKRLGFVTGVFAGAVIGGCLLSRTMAGGVAVHWGWRSVYELAAITTALMLVIVVRFVRPQRPPLTIGYGKLLGSLAGLARSEPTLRIAAFCQVFTFGSFNVFWLGSTLYLQERFGWNTEAIGYVGALGAVAAICAPILGRATTRFGSRPTRVAALAAVVAAWAILAAFGGSVAGLAIGLIALNLGSTATDIANRTLLYGSVPHIRTRLNAIYTIAMFLGGGVTSLLVGMSWVWGGWLGVCALGGASASAGLIIARGTTGLERYRET